MNQVIFDESPYTLSPQEIYDAFQFRWRIAPLWMIFVKPPFHFQTCIWKEDEGLCNCVIDHDHVCEDTKREMDKRKRLMALNRKRRLERDRRELVSWLR